MAELEQLQISGNYFDARPLFVEHRGLLLCAFGSDVQAISVHTGSLVGTFRGHSALVSCIVNPVLPAAASNRVVTAVVGPARNGGVLAAHSGRPEDCVISTSLDGAIIVWSLVSPAPTLFPLSIN